MIKIIKQDYLNRDDAFSSSAPESVTKTVSDIISDVIQRGDTALKEYTLKFDKCDLDNIQVTDEEIEFAFNNIDPEFIEILKEAADNIRVFHEKQVRTGFIQANDNGSVVGQRIIPLEKVGLYVPGGTAAYPSTVLMDSIPAKVAGCKEIVVVTPPDSNGNIPSAILAAAKIAGVNKIFKVGGAQAVAALAYGTETIPKVDKIAGPGNMFVAEAKRQVYGRVDIDMIAGPSEILVIADKNSDARIIAADLLSQAEHDKNASAVLVTDSMELANAVSFELERQISLLERSEIARESVDNKGLIIVTSSIDVAVDIANEIAPEHLEISVDEPFKWLGKVNNAGSVFLGRYCPEALGDYFAGPNHTLPTSGTARFSSPLSVDDFVKKSQYIYYTEDALKGVYKKVAAFAAKEGLTAHAKSVLSRFEEF
jgi:histidinol dehydrogenase